MDQREQKVMTTIKHRIWSCWYCRNKRLAALIVLTAVAVLAMPLFLISKPENVSGLTVKKATYDAVVLSWKKADNASEYQIYRSQDKKEYEKIAETKNTEWIRENKRS